MNEEESLEDRVKRLERMLTDLIYVLRLWDGLPAYKLNEETKRFVERIGGYITGVMDQDE